MEEIDEIKSRLQLYGIPIIKAKYIQPEGYVTGTYKFETADNRTIGIDQLKYWDTRGAIIGDVAEEYFKLERRNMKEKQDITYEKLKKKGFKQKQTRYEDKKIISEQYIRECAFYNEKIELDYDDQEVFISTAVDIETLEIILEKLKELGWQGHEPKEDDDDNTLLRNYLTKGLTKKEEKSGE